MSTLRGSVRGRGTAFDVAALTPRVAVEVDTGCPPGCPGCSEVGEGPETLLRVAARGWVVVAVAPEASREERHHHTVGLTAQGLPEVVVHGLPFEVGGAVLDEVARRMLTGEAEVGARLPGVLEGVDVVLVPTRRLLSPLTALTDAYGRVPVLQLVTPDLDGRFPWEPGFDTTFAQPELWRGAGS